MANNSGSVSFWTPIYDSKAPCFSAVEGYFDWTGRRVSVFEGFAKGEQWIEPIQQKLSCWNVALKVASCCTIIFPVIVLIAKIAFRCSWNSSCTHILTKEHVRQELQGLQTKLKGLMNQVKKNEVSIRDQVKVLIDLKKKILIARGTPPPSREGAESHSQQTLPVKGPCLVKRATTLAGTEQPKQEFQDLKTNLKEIPEWIRQNEERIKRQTQILTDLMTEIDKARRILNPASENPSNLSHDVLGQICSFLTLKEIGVATQINHSWQIAIDHSDGRVWKPYISSEFSPSCPMAATQWKILTRQSEQIFGVKSWETYFGQKVTDIPPLPPDIDLRQDLLVLIPKDMSLTKIGDLAKTPIKGHASTKQLRYPTYYDNQPNRFDVSVLASYWIAITPQKLSNQYARTIEQQTTILDEYNRKHITTYRMPTAIEAAVVNFVYHARFGQYFHPGDYMYCRDTVGGDDPRQLLVGNRIQFDGNRRDDHFEVNLSGFIFSEYCYVAGVREFPSSLAPNPPAPSGL